MSDREFVEAFESCALPPEQFHHRDHIRLAWVLMHELPFVDAAVRFTHGLKRFAANLGKPGLYHETITWAYLVLVHERIARDENAEWETFQESNPDLFTWQPSILNHYYEAETLSSELARRVFLLPDARV